VYAGDKYMFFRHGTVYVLVDSHTLPSQLNAFERRRWKRVEPAFRAAGIVEAEFFENRQNFMAGMRRLCLHAHVLHSDWLGVEGWLRWIRDSALTDWMGQLHLYEVEFATNTFGVKAPAVTEPAEYETTSLEWIEIALVDQLGHPAANVEYRVKAADGHTRRGRTGAAGLARISDIPAGACEFTLTQTDSRAWEADGAQASGTSTSKESFQPLTPVYHAGPRDTLYAIAYMATCLRPSGKAPTTARCETYAPTWPCSAPGTKSRYPQSTCAPRPCPPFSGISSGC
jgi:hypothetical protein